MKNAAQYISNFEQAVAYEASKRSVNGVICGHIHRAEITRIGEILYCNCGDWVPVAAYPVTGPIDLIRPGVTGSLDQDLKKAVTQALRLNPDDCVAFAQNHSWKACAERFLACLAVVC